MTATSEQIYAVAYVAEFNRLKALGITQNFVIGYPYRGVSGNQVWTYWCADMAHEHAQTTCEVFIGASNQRYAKRKPYNFR